MNVEAFVQDTVSRSLDKYLEVHPSYDDTTLAGRVSVVEQQLEGVEAILATLNSGNGA